MRTSGIVVTAGVLLAAVMGLYAVVQIEPASLRLMLVVLSTWMLMGMAMTAVVLLVVAGVGAARGAQPNRTDAGAVALVITIAGVAMILDALAILTLAWAPDLAMLGVIGLLLTAVALVDWQRWPTRHGAVALLLLASVPVVVTLYRELDVLAVTNFGSDSHTQQDFDLHETCDGVDWPDRAQVRTVADAYRLDVLLDGNVGSILRHPAGTDRVDGRLELRVVGTADIGWTACLVPLYKSVHLETTLTFDGSVAVDHGQGSASCQVNGTVAIQLDYTMRGIASCRDLREQVAQEVHEIVVKRARSMIDG